MPLAPSPTLAVLSREAATCSLTLNASACDSGNATLARPVGMTVQAAASTPLTVHSSGNENASTTALTLDGLTVSGASECGGTLVATCVDANGNTASTAGQPSSPVVTLAAWRVAWNHSLPSPLVLVPAQLPDLSAAFSAVDPRTNAQVSLVDFGAAVTSFLSCTAVLMSAAAEPPAPGVALDRLPSRDVLSSATGTVLGSEAAVATTGLTFAGLTAASAPLGGPVVVYAECTWSATGERIRLPPLPATVLRLRLAWASPLPPSVLLGRVPHPIRVALEVTDSVTAAATASTVSTCSLLLLNATERGAALAADTWSMALDAGAPAGTAVYFAPNVTLQAPPGTRLYVQATCEAWAHAAVSPPLLLTTAALEVRVTSALPTSFVASDASSPWPLDPPLMLTMQSVEGGEATTDATCAIGTSTAGAELVVVDATATTSSLLSVGADPATGVVRVPAFVVQSSPMMPALTLTVACQRVASGDAAPTLTFSVPAVQLRAAFCNTPQAATVTGVALPPFAVGIATNTSSTVTPACDTTGGPALPPIVCTIALNASASTVNSTTDVFVQHSTAITIAPLRTAEFDAFSLVAPPGETYGLSLTCSVGSLAIPPPLAFAVSLQGCDPGQHSVSVTCVTCGNGEFSLGGSGAHCIGCPPVGATCEGGNLTLHLNYYRPASQAGQPLGPDTELHPCYNAEACTLEVGSNVRGTAVYGCAYGYSGPLCGVCDAAVNYARFGEACALCWDDGASWTFLMAIVLVVLAVLTRVALRKDSGRSDASIVLRITLGYLQAVGSLRVFRAGGTKAYGSVMGWTEVVSASPLSVGALQCLLWLPYLFQYVATILLPAFAAAAVVVIFHAVTTGRSLHCKPRCGMDTAAFRSAVASWWATKRHLSTLLFVLFLAYMPIVSASLRVLDCIAPIAGVRYLRSDLRVECGVGEHAAARVLAYSVLAVVGIGFPTGLAWLLGTATPLQLADGAFHATWGFLFDGYRAPSRTQLAVAGSATSDSSTGTSVVKTACAAAQQGRRRSSLQLPDRLVQTWVVSGDSRVWWEAVVLCRKAGVVLLAVLVTNPYLQCVGATLWFAGAAVLQAHYTPYATPLYNRLELASLVATFLTAVVSTALLQFNVSVASADLHTAATMTAIEWSVTVALVVMNVGTLAVLAGYWFYLQARRVQVGALWRASASLRRLPGINKPPASLPRDSAPATINPLHVHGAGGGSNDGIMLTGVRTEVSRRTDTDSGAAGGVS